MYEHTSHEVLGSDPEQTQEYHPLVNPRTGKSFEEKERQKGLEKPL